MILHRLLSEITRQERSKLNENFDRIERSYKGVIDTSNEARDKSTIALKVANDIDGKATEALNNSNQAVSMSNTAKTTAEYVQSQLDNVIADGDSLAEVVQARAEFVNLRDRLDSEFGQITDQLAQTASKTEVEILKQQLIPKRELFGGQLMRLRNALSSPFHQYISIVLIGDSITWGMSATGNPQITPRNGTLTDVRDLFSSRSWANNFKKYIGQMYANKVTPILSNHATSPSGESIATYTTRHMLFPLPDEHFKYTFTGSTSYEPGFKYRASGNSLLGFQVTLLVGASEDYQMEMEFLFTGKSFTLSYDAIPTSMDYELFVDDVSQGVFVTRTSVASGEYNKQRTHEFDFIDNKLIKIVSVKRTDINVNQSLYLGGIIIDKEIVIKNQGIIGTTAKLYKERNVDSDANGNVFENDDKYIFMQLGTNDRLIANGVIKGVSGFKHYYQNLVDAIKVNKDVILMCANPVSNENPNTYSFNMQDVKNTVRNLAQKEELDFIDNYSVFGDVSISSYTTDGIHPNDDGHEVIFRNIVNAIEFK